MSQSQYLPPVYKDRRGWLIAFGVVEILIACFLVLMAAVMILAIPSMPKTPQQPPVPEGMFYAIGAFYLALAAGFVTVGVGSIRAREWARITMIVVSSIWLTFGFLGTLFSAILMPAIMRQQQQSMPQQPHMPGGFQTTVLVITIAIQAVIMVVTPLLLLLFYCNKNVKATCQTSSRSIGALPASSRWPIPILVLIVWFSFGALSMVSVAFWVPAIAFFGVFVRGVPAQILFAVVAISYVYCAWAFYKLRQEGWWLAVVTSVFWLVSGVVSMIVLGPARMLEESYKYMKIQPQLGTPFTLSPQAMTGGFIFSMLLSAGFVALIVYCKRFFPARTPA
jgi:hypothetical protein